MCSQALGRPLPGVMHVGCQAQLGLNKPLQAAAQLAAWLREGGQASEEACSTVTAFLQALQQAPAKGAAAAAGSAKVLQQLVQAAAARCSTEPAVAVSVLLELLQVRCSGVRPAAAMACARCCCTWRS